MSENKRDIVERIRTVFNDTEEIASWCDKTYNGRETQSHLLGLYAAALEACKEIEQLRVELKRHPGYIVGDHWLQAAYTRICTGETEDEVMADYGWQRESR